MRKNTFSFVLCPIIIIYYVLYINVLYQCCLLFYFLLLFSCLPHLHHILCYMFVFCIRSTSILQIINIIIITIIILWTLVMKNLFNLLPVLKSLFFILILIYPFVKIYLIPQHIINNKQNI
jgi:hypothetical protein